MLKHMSKIGGLQSPRQEITVRFELHYLDQVLINIKKAYFHKLIPIFTNFLRT